MMRDNQLPGGSDLARHSTGMFSEADYNGVGFGLGFAMDLKSQEYYWGGVFSTYFWIDPTKAVAGVVMMQVLPFADKQSLVAYRQFERGIYRALG